MEGGLPGGGRRVSPIRGGTYRLKFG